MCVESTGIGAPEPSRVVLHPDGWAEVFAGSTPQGQGHETFLAQVAADRLDWPIERIEVRVGDSRNVPFSTVTAGSRSALEVGNSVARSAASARRQLLDLAAETLAAEDIVVGPEGAFVRGAPERALPLADVVGEGVTAFETWDSAGASAWTSSCHVAVVRIDLETGGVEMLRYVGAHDSGRAINPTLMEGQLHAGTLTGSATPSSRRRPTRTTGASSRLPSSTTPRPAPRTVRPNRTWSTRSRPVVKTRRGFAESARRGR